MATKYRALIRRNADGVERWSPWSDYYGEDATRPGLILFSWRENNHSCDCNRHLEFERAGGRNDGSEMEDEIECGDDVLYSVLRFENDDGEVLIEEGVPRWAVLTPAAPQSTPPAYR